MRKINPSPSGFANDSLHCLPIFLIGMASCTGYLNRGASFWAGELGLPAVLALTATSCFGLYKRLFLTISGIDRLFLLYLAYLLVNAAAQSYPFPPTDRILLPVINLLFYLLIRNISVQGSRKLISGLTNGVIGIALFQSIIGLLQYIGVLSPFHPDYKSVGLFINPGIYGCFVAIGFCMAAIMLIERWHKNGFLYGSALLLCGCALVLSRSLTACISAIAGIGCYLAMSRPAIPDLLRQWRRLAVFTVLIVIASCCVLLSQTDFSSFQGRLLIWKISLNMVLDSPLFGQGYGSFYNSYPDYQAGYFMAGKGSAEEIQLASVNYYAFNEPLRILIEGGIVGFLFLGAILTAISLVLKKNSSSKTGMLLFCLLLVIFIFGLFSYPLSDISLSLLATFSIAAIASMPGLAGGIKLIVIKPLFRFICLGALLVLTGGAMLRIYAVCCWKEAKQHLAEQEGDSMRTYARIYPLLSNNASFLYNYGSELAELGQIEAGLAVLERSLRYGNSIEHHLAIGDMEKSLGNLKTAEQAYRYAAYMDPKRFVPFYKLLQFYRETRQEQKAKKIAAMLCAKPVKVQSPIIDRIKQETCTYEKDN
ncbi:hypothetical protein BWD42_12930 [Sphingobacterium sp. CZ-UAM]|uniref:O-antigen ligase family protein n=1 Tax=Sphingobacterium sp. CZ-UAM TaxID=1933868 RepID=UPI000985455D|nr:O-antigen ligase family protein [Sphingobacterium sp. CZ-UAM]OOG18165.1 hypothetical protein BWD42_12930 [Sphingobacterium sp. CZ-UAM]